jgi:hypothetical protein
LTLIVTGTPASALRLPSSAVTVASTVSVPSLDMVPELSAKTKSAALGPPPAKGEVPLSPPPPPHAANATKANIESRRFNIVMVTFLGEVQRWASLGL